jgi:hypothetical protein
MMNYSQRSWNDAVYLVYALASNHLDAAEFVMQMNVECVQFKLVINHLATLRALSVYLIAQRLDKLNLKVAMMLRGNV